ncbi:MAG: hypothetical protein ACI3ZQ_06990 [Candidatus Cryptobacteroides sp.]
MKKILFAFLLTVASFSAIAAEAPEKHGKKHARKGEVVEHLQNHYKFYGFIRNYFAFDTRECTAGTGDLFFYLPKDENWNEDHSVDLNQQNSFRFLSLTSRVGVDVTGYQVGNVHFGAKFEADFYAGLSGVTGTATLRLRQAYATVTWKDLALNGKEKASVALKMGQAWHPFAADMPHSFSLETGAPFGPFSRTPQITMDANLGSHWTLSASAIWQMQYTSAGPAGASANYLKYALNPEAYFGLTYKTGGFLVRAGVDVLSIKPRNTGTVTKDIEGVPTAVKVKVKDRLTTVSPFVFLQYAHGLFGIKAKTVFGEAGEHFNLMSGYAHTSTNEDGSWGYTPLRNSSTWVSLSYGKKWQGVLFGGYVKNLGLKAASELPLTKDDIYFSKNGVSTIRQMWRIEPEILFNYGKFTIGLEYNYTAVEYGDGKSYCSRGLADTGRHWVGNHRIQGMIKFTF